jgi:hypothetical protein
VTRGTWLSILLASPLAVLRTGKVMAGHPGEEDNLVVLAPGKYTIAPGGGIRINGADRVIFKGHTVFEAGE